MPEEASHFRRNSTVLRSPIDAQAGRFHPATKISELAFLESLFSTLNQALHDLGRT